MIPVLQQSLPFLGDDVLFLEEVLDTLEFEGIEGPHLFRASEREKRDRILVHGTDRGGYAGARPWRYNDSQTECFRHEDVILGTTADEIRHAASDPAAASSIQKFAIIAAPLLLVYDARSLRRLRGHHHAFRDPGNKGASLRAIFEVEKYAAIQGWFCQARGLAYRDLVRRAAESAGDVVEVGCWRGRSTSWIARLCALRGITLHCVDTWQGSSDSFDVAYRSHLQSSDIQAEFRANMTALGAAPIVWSRSSIDAAETFAPESLSLVFLDASHDSPAVAADLQAWFPKIRAEGMLAGDDYKAAHPGVCAAVQAFARLVSRSLEVTPEGLWSIRK